MGTEYGWEKVAGFNGGHRYFKCTVGRDITRIGIADDSGSVPHLCDEFIWLDRSRAIELSDDGHWLVPVLEPQDDDSERKTVTFASADEALGVAAGFGMEIRIAGYSLVVTQRLG